MTTIDRDGTTFTVGPGGDLTPDDVDNLRNQIKRYNAVHSTKVEKVSIEMLKAILSAKRAFPDSWIADVGY